MTWNGSEEVVNEIMRKMKALTMEMETVTLVCKGR